MNIRLRLLATVAMLGVLMLAVGAPIASANFFMGVSVASRCGDTSAEVTITTFEITQAGATVKIVVQVQQPDGTFADTSSTVTVPIQVNSTSTTVTVTIPANSTYRVRAELTNLSPFNGTSSEVSNTITCTASTPTPTPTSTSTATPVSTATSTATPMATATSTPTPTNTPPPPESTLTPTPTNTPPPPPPPAATATPTNTPGSGGGGGSSPKPAPTAVLVPEQPSAPAVAAPPPPPPPPAPPTPTPTVQVAGVQAAAPPAAPPQAAPPAAMPPPPPAPPCVDAVLVPVLDAVTGQQMVDKATGLPMWLTVGDDSGVVSLGAPCPRADVPLALPATGDGSTATEFINWDGSPVSLP